MTATLSRTTITIPFSIAQTDKAALERGLLGAMATAQGIGAALSVLLQKMEEDKAIQETIRDNAKAVERAQRLLAAHSNRFHSTRSGQIAAVVEESAPLFAECREAIAVLTTSVPEHHYWKYNGTWSTCFSAIVGSASTIYFLSTGLLLTKEESSAILGLTEEDASRVFLTSEEYLHGVINMVNELSRLAMNAVILGDYASPLRMSAFVKEVHAGFQLLNLKNDNLRKRFDAIKYDVKRIEEVVYDLSLRKLLTADDIAAIDLAAPIAPPNGASSSSTSGGNDSAQARTRAILTGRPS